MYLYPIWIRLWHLFNAVLILVLIYTGISMQYTDRENMAIIAGFAKAVKWHNIAAVLLTFNYMLFVLGNLFTGNGKYYRIGKKDFIKNLWSQLRYYSYGMFRGEKHPFPVTLERKFNPLQKLSYVLTMYMAMPLLIISGLGLLFPEIIINRFLGVSGLIFNDLLHVTTGFLISVFMVIHIYTCTLGSSPTSLFRGIISGYHETGDH